MAVMNNEAIVDLLIKYWKNEALDIPIRKGCWQLARKIEAEIRGADPADLKRRPEEYRDSIGKTIDALSQSDVAAQELLRSLTSTQRKNEGAGRAGQRIDFIGDNNLINLAGRDVNITYNDSRSRPPNAGESERKASTAESAVESDGVAPPADTRIFICYSRGDEPKARELYHRLKTDGFSPWMDKEELLPGQEWKLEITKTVKNADVCIACLSKKSVDKRGYVQKEIRLALDVAEEMPEGRVFIIPLKLEECDIPTRLSEWHCENFDQRGYEKLVKQLRKLAAKA